MNSSSSATCMRRERMKPIDLSQIFLGIGAVIPDRGVDAVVTHGCHEDHQRAEAIAEQGNLAVAFREIAYYAHGVLDVLYAGIPVISRIETKAVLPVGFGGDVQVDARLLPPVQVWSDREVALFRQFITVLTNVCVHAEQFLQNDDSRSRRGLRSCDIGGERAALPFYGDVIHHFVLLRRLCSYRISADPDRIGGDHFVRKHAYSLMEVAASSMSLAVSFGKDI